jgi:hypothetical protein
VAENMTSTQRLEFANQRLRPDTHRRSAHIASMGRSTPTIAQPLKLGHEWYVVARHRSGQQEHVRRFKTETEAKYWISRKSKAWLKKRGYAND